MNDAVERVVDLSPTQRGLWFLDRLVPESPLYTLAWRIVLAGGLDVAALHEAANAVVARHEALRTRFGFADGAPRQVVLPDLHVPLPVEDLRGVAPAERDTAVESVCRAEIGTGFDIGTAPLIRLRLLRTKDDEHVLLLLVHHLVFDAVSFDVFLAELADDYRVIVSGGRPSTAPHPVQYRHFTAWQQRRLSGRALRRMLDHWAPRLTGAPAVLDLPTDRPRPAAQSFAGAQHRFRLSGPLCEALREVARSERATSFMALLAVLQVLLSRYADQQDICVGTPVSGRVRAEVERTVGFFINTVVLRGDLSDRPTFREFLRRTRDVSLDAFDNQELPFDRLVEELRPTRSLSHNPLFQVLFLAHYRQDRDLPGLRVTEVEPLLGMGWSRFDLSVITFEDEDGIEVRVEYGTDLFDRPTVERFGRHFEQLLRVVTDDPDLPVDSVDFRLPEDRRLLRTTRDTAVEVPGVTLPELVSAQVARTPDAPAVIAADRGLTYAELDARADALAAELVRRGAGPDAVVAVALPRSVELVVALLGVLKAGAAYLPLDPDHPAGRTAAMVRDATPVAVVAAGPVAGLPPTLPVVGLDLDGAPEGAVRPAPPHPDNAAYVLFTSGSTGRPKGVVVSHRAIVNRLLWARTELGFTAADRLLQKTPPTFDVSVWEFFLPLVTGAALVVAEPGGHRDPAYLARAIREFGVTVVHFVPSMLRVFLDAPEARRCTGLRQVVSSGEALSAELRARCHHVLDVELHNLYGPTEAAVDVSWWRCARHSDVTPPLGHPIWNTALYVLDGTGRPVPAGVVGELHIGGVQLARGYANRPGLTADRFIPDPFGPPGARMYRTGDLARWRADGAVEYLGRADHQVKVRGFRVEPGEVEAVLTGHPAVEQAVVVADGERLVAYVSGPVGGAADRREVEHLREFAALALPDFMVPGAVIHLDAFPLSPNGKLDRGALPRPPAPQTGERVAGRTPVERVVCTVLSDVLGAEVGAHDDFFALGGHSLLAARAVLLLGELLDADLPVAAVFRHPTAARLAEHLAAAHADPAALTTLAATAEEVFALPAEEVRARLGG